MQINVHTDNSVSGTHGLVAHVEREVASALTRFGDHLTRVEVHLSDESAGRSTGGDMRCLIEARPEGRRPVTVTEDADSVGAALTGAVHRLTHLLSNDEGRERELHGRRSIRHDVNP